MTLQLEAEPVLSKDTAPLTQEGHGARADRTFRRVALAAGATVLLILLLIALTTTNQAWPAFSELGLDYFLGTEWVPSEGLYGILPLVYGTVVVSLIAVLFAVPVSVGIALFITELAHRRMRSSITLVIDLLAAVPSVVFGLWGFYTLIPVFQGVFNSIADAVSGFPVLNVLFQQGSGSSFRSAGLILALMITPIITSVTRGVSVDKDKMRGAPGSPLELRPESPRPSPLPQAKLNTAKMNAKQTSGERDMGAPSRLYRIAYGALNARPIMEPYRVNR